VALYAISKDNHEQSKRLSEKIAERGGGPLTFPLLADTQHRVIDAYGLQDPRYLKMREEGIPYPTAYVIDKTGRVAWTRLDQDTTQRPANSEIRAALDKLK
jgi:peroxiredoxin